MCVCVYAGDAQDVLGDACGCMHVFLYVCMHVHVFYMDVMNRRTGEYVYIYHDMI
jgi:hypothetical protein